jgi:hypothetical protein
MVYTCTKIKHDLVKHVSCVSHELPETGGEQKLVVWSWSGQTLASLLDGLSCAP